MNKGRGEGEERRLLWFITGRKFCFSSVHANCVCVHLSFSLSRLTEQLSPGSPLLLHSSPLFHTISQSDWLPPLLSACQHFYTFVQGSSSIHCPRSEVVWSQYVMKGDYPEVWRKYCYVPNKIAPLFEKPLRFHARFELTHRLQISAVFEDGNLKKKFM